MPFAVQCPVPTCRKYILVEDAARGTVINCLICRAPLPIPAADGSPPASLTPAAPPVSLVPQDPAVPPPIPKSKRPDLPVARPLPPPPRRA